MAVVVKAALSIFHFTLKVKSSEIFIETLNTHNLTSVSNLIPGGVCRWSSTAFAFAVLLLFLLLQNQMVRNKKIFLVWVFICRKCLNRHLSTGHKPFIYFQMRKEENREKKRSDFLCLSFHTKWKIPGYWISQEPFNHPDEYDRFRVLG